MARKSKAEPEQPPAGEAPTIDAGYKEAQEALAAGKAKVQACPFNYEKVIGCRGFDWSIDLGGSRPILWTAPYRDEAAVLRDFLQRVRRAPQDAAALLKATGFRVVNSADRWYAEFTLKRFNEYRNAVARWEGAAAAAPAPAPAPAPKPAVSPAPKPAVSPAPKPAVSPAPKPAASPAPKQVAPAPKPVVKDNAPGKLTAVWDLLK